MSAPRLWLVRHARPEVAPGLCYGRLDVAADARHSRESARLLAQALPPVWPPCTTLRYKDVSCLRSTCLPCGPI